MLMAALKAEADSFVVRFGDELLPDGRQRVVRHGVICGAKRGSSYEPSLAAVVVNGREGAVDDELSGRHVRQRRMKEPSGKRSPASAAALMQATLCDRANGERLLLGMTGVKDERRLRAVCAMRASQLGYLFVGIG